jgi:hypothetical protein
MIALATNVLRTAKGDDPARNAVVAPARAAPRPPPRPPGV